MSAASNTISRRDLAFVKLLDAKHLSDAFCEPARGDVAYPALAALLGVEHVRAFLSRRAPAPPIARLTGRRIIDASFGSATYALRATDWMLGTKGVVHSGVLDVLADGALIASVPAGGFRALRKPAHE